MFSIHFRHSLLRSGILKGRTDIHSHILPGVDDGSPDIPNSLDLLDYMGDIGYKEVWLTPHVMADLHQTTDHLQQVFDDFKSHYKGPLQLHLAAEYMMDAAFRDQLIHDGRSLSQSTEWRSPPSGSRPPPCRDLLYEWPHGPS